MKSTSFLSSFFLRIKGCSNEFKVDSLDQCTYREVLSDLLNSIDQDIANPASSIHKYQRGRNGIDRGMYDIPLSYFSDRFPLLLQFPGIMSSVFCRMVGIDVSPSSTATRIYHYVDADNPRVTHFDTLRRSFKCFLSLSANTSLQNGFYYYLPYSHFLNKFFYVLNKLLARACLVNTSSKMFAYNLPPFLRFPFFYKRFFPLEYPSCFITRQDGFHGDYPMITGSSSCKRTAMVFVINDNFSIYGSSSFFK